MIAAALLLAATAAVQAAPASPTAATAVDPARIAAAQRLLDTFRIEAQYDQMFAKLIPIMSIQIFTALKDNEKAPARLRTFLSDSANEAQANQVFTEESLRGFKARYPQMRAATASEYARIFSTDELVGLNAFYTSPLGQKALASLPDLQNKLMPIGMAAGMDVGREAMLRMVARLGLDDEPKPRS